MVDSHPSPLQGLRVIELGNFIAAPTAGRLLADFGAEVIKIERPGTGDEIRRWRLYEGDTSMLYRTINRNKRSISLDLHSERGRFAVQELVRNSDVVLENFRPGTLEKWGLGPDELDRIKPGIIIVRISAFGQTGPLAPLPGFAAVAEGFGGFRELVGDPDRPPARVGVSIGDSIAGIYAAFGAVTALLQRQRNISGAEVPLAHRIVDVALNESMLSVMESLLPDYSAYDVTRERLGGRVEGIAPSNAYVCADGASIVISGNANGIFPIYMTVINRPDLATDPALQNNDERWARRDELDSAIGAWAATLSSSEALRILEEAGVPAGPIYTAADILKDEQYAARNMVQRIDVSTGKRVIRNVAFPGIVPVTGGVSAPIRNLGPDLGADTHDVLTSILGWSAEEAAEFLEGQK